MDIKEIQARIKEYESSEEYRDLMLYDSYYATKNHELYRKWRDRENRRISPNWAIPTAYYPTIIDSMAGYLMSNIQYELPDKTTEEQLKELLKSTKADVKDMKTGTFALAYNRAYELVYFTEEKGISFASIPPLQVIPVYSDDIEPVLETAIWRRNSKGRILVDVISKDLWQYFEEVKDEGSKETKLVEIQDEKPLTLPSCPMVEYRTELIGDKSSFDQVINYIIALDWAISGNSNEIERLTDAILVLGKILEKKDVEHMDELKVLGDITKEEVAPYFLEKESSPEFRKYVTELLVNEIHKHSHVVDWYNAELTGGATSAKALITRLFDMNMYSNRIEKVYRDGIYQRMNLISYYTGTLNNTPLEDLTIKFVRTLPDDISDYLINLKSVDWISNTTKQKLCMLDPEVEAENFKKEAELEPKDPLDE